MSQPDDAKHLFLKFHGRIIESLGIQMYQSPVAAVAELVANSWDADAENVAIDLPTDLSGNPTIVIKDDGHGMTFEECQNSYLSVGRNRRLESTGSKSLGGRPVLGRKGIGKLAGFGIADTLELVTTSKHTGETTHFKLDIDQLTSNDYISTDQKNVDIIRYSEPNEENKNNHGTKIILSKLKLSVTPNKDRFAQSMARRFLINQAADDFKVLVNGSELPEDNYLSDVEFDFPNDYTAGELPENLQIEDGWGVEEVNGNQIKWRFKFTKNTIGSNEFRGIAIYCGIKVAQTPFFFNLSGGLDGQHGQQYMSGIVQADFLDQSSSDVITTERQRINWEIPAAHDLESWGQDRVKSLLAIWKDRRSKEKSKILDGKVAGFSARLEKLPPSERDTVKGAIRKLAGIPSLHNDQFVSLSEAILTAWEGGRLMKLIERVSDVENMDEGVLLSILAETQILTALHQAEAVKAKLEVILGLEDRIKDRELENAVRDYIAKHPWLLSPEWETFRIERGIQNLVDDALDQSGINRSDDWNGRVDLVLSSGKQLLIVEFMRPGLTLDYDHIDRFARYIRILREGIFAQTGLGYEIVTGLLVAENLERKAGQAGHIESLKRDNMDCLEWPQLLAKASAQWREFLDALGSRTPTDDRLKQLQNSSKKKEDDDEATENVVGDGSPVEEPQ